MFEPPTPYPIKDYSAIKDFFDQIEPDFSEPHGNPERLFKYRIRLIKESIHLHDDDVILEIGCGKGQHLMALMDENRKGTGIDISSRMIEKARLDSTSSPFSKNVVFEIDNAEQLHGVADSSINVVVCIGALEHMLDKKTVAQNVFRVLKGQGQFFCMSPSGDYSWYRSIAPLFKINTKHLSSDEFITKSKIQEMLSQVGFRIEKIKHWTFIPKGDVPFFFSGFLQFLDLIGKLFRISAFRGGILFTAIKT
jgi:2-polyprenyl-6-hydroxyphenyl methylase/3-demethylubiquinone-9 3-methyltransferase